MLISMFDSAGLLVGYLQREEVMENVARMALATALSSLLSNRHKKKTTKRRAPDQK